MTSTRTLRLAFAAALVVVLALSLWPLPEPPPLHTGWDKTDHLAAFVALGLLGLPSWPGERVRVAGGLLAYGVLIEVLQGLTGYRMADWRDFVADAAGVALAALLLAWWRGRRSAGR
ncbi:MAG: VanZ family protein [Polyangiaceae bacterium]|nr:VanZ family protein [Polyangiaceae bacterium]